MDLIYADKNKVDIGILKDYNFDLAYGSDENNFELSVSTSNNVCDEDYLIYIEGTEYGGIIDSVEINTENKIVKYKGRTYHGLLDKKVLSPDASQDYLTLSGDMNVIINTIISRVYLGSMFRVSTKTTKTISYKFDRYITAYAGIKKMLADNGYKLKVTYENGYVVLEAVPIVEYDEDSGLDSDRINFQIQKTYNIINHLICLGQGNLKDRQVVHLYLDRNGNISTTQVFTGVEELTEVYDYPNAESLEELTSKGKEKLLSQNTNSIELTLGENYEFDIGDKITVTDIVTGIEVSRHIAKKIITINKDRLKINYSVGD